MLTLDIPSGSSGKNPESVVEHKGAMNYIELANYLNIFSFRLTSALNKGARSGRNFPTSYKIQGERSWHCFRIGDLYLFYMQVDNNFLY